MSRPVAVSLESEGLRLAESDGGGGAETWPYAALSLRREERRNGAVRLTHGDARLVIEDPAFAAALAVAAPRLGHAARRTLIYGTIATILLLAAVGGLWWEMPTIAALIAEHIPVAWEQKLGAEVELDPWLGKRCTNPAGEAALVTLTHRLIAGVPEPYPLVVGVRDNGMINAFALPGGHIVLLKGLLSEAQSPDEVAGVLAHELTHVLKRHPLRALIANSGLALLFEITVGNGSGASLGLLLTTLSYTRTMEAEADAGALKLLHHAGIGTQGFAAFFERLVKRDHGTKLPYLNSHPPSEERLAAAQAQAQAGTRPALSDAEWQALKAICTTEAQ